MLRSYWGPGPLSAALSGHISVPNRVAVFLFGKVVCFCPLHISLLELNDFHVICMKFLLTLLTLCYPYLLHFIPSLFAFRNGELQTL